MARFTDRIKSLIAAAALVAGASGAASAADLGLPPPPMIPPPEPPAFSGWYLRGDVGVGFDDLSSFSSNAAGAVAGYQFNGAGLGMQSIFGVGVGYQFNNWFRADLTGEYRNDSKYWANESYAGGVGYGPGSDGYFGQVNSLVGLANGYVNIGTWYGFSPFIGAGVGVARTSFHGLMDIGLGPSNYGGFGTAATSYSTRFAWALMAGVDYMISPNWVFELGYRYLDMGNVGSAGIVCTPACTPPYEVQHFHLASNDVRVGVRYIFASAPPIAPPLVTKY